MKNRKTSIKATPTPKAAKKGKLKLLPKGANLIDMLGWSRNDLSMYWPTKKEWEKTNPPSSDPLMAARQEHERKQLKWWAIAKRYQSVADNWFRVDPNWTKEQKREFYTKYPEYRPTGGLPPNKPLPVPPNRNVSGAQRAKNLSMLGVHPPVKIEPDNTIRIRPGFTGGQLALPAPPPPAPKVKTEPVYGPSTNSLPPIRSLLYAPAAPVIPPALMNMTNLNLGHLKAPSLAPPKSVGFVPPVITAPVIQAEDSDKASERVVEVGDL